MAARERASAQKIEPGATSINAIYEALIGTDRPWMGPVFLTALVLIVLVLYIDLRSVRLVVLTLVPVLCASTVAIGGLSAVGFSFNTVTLVAVPLLLGLGVDDGIHIVHRMLEEPERSLPGVVASVGRGIAMTTATTVASVSMLLCTNHPGIISVGVLLIVGLPLCLLASVSVMPACAVLLNVRERTPRR